MTISAERKTEAAEFRDPGGRRVIAVSYDKEGHPFSIACEGETWDAEWSRIDQMLYVNRCGGGREPGCVYVTPTADPFAGAEESHAMFCETCSDYRPTTIGAAEQGCPHLSWCKRCGWFRGPSPDAAHRAKKCD